MNILDEIVEKTKIRINQRKKDFEFENAITNDKISFICEVKKASPSKGIISENFDYKQIAMDYQAAGADAISVLTEPEYFKGSDEYLKEIKDIVKIPVLRKDFTVDEYQIYQAKMLNADAVLLIVSILNKDTLKHFLETSEMLGLCALVETRDEKEIETALNAGAKIIGVNNRDLKTFEVDIQISANLRKFVPNDKIFVSESGIKTRQDVEFLEANNVNAALIGEELMKARDVKKKISLLRGV